MRNGLFAEVFGETGAKTTISDNNCLPLPSKEGSFVLYLVGLEERSVF